MSTITYRDGIMAADSRAYAGGPTPIGFKKKLRKLVDGSMIGISTTLPGLSELVMDYFDNCASDVPNIDYPQPEIGEKKITILLVTADGEVYYADDSLNLSGPLDGEFWAIGSGEAYALGAMECGASAEEAIEIAKKFDVWSDGPVFRLVNAEEFESTTG